ncbi:MAG: hypothetical protein OHK0045_15580 [Raineya sp.]
MKKYVCLFWLICFGELRGQINVSDIGFSVGWGYALNHRSVPEGVYRLLYMQGLVRTQILPSSKQKRIFEAVYLGVEPQYNLVWIDKEQSNFEGGLHLFLQPTFSLSERWKAFFIAGVGPHYFSTSTASQARGFIFSDAMGLGLHFKWGTKNSIFTSFRIRHLSNANTRMPNLGINTYNFHFGYTRSLTIKIK